MSSKERAICALREELEMVRSWVGWWSERAQRGGGGAHGPTASGAHGASCPFSAVQAVVLSDGSGEDPVGDQSSADR